MAISSLLPTHRSAALALDALRVRGGSLLLVGAPGSGKTRFLEHYVASRPPGPWAGSVYLHRTDVVNTPLSLVSDLLLQLGHTASDTRHGMRTLIDTLAPGAMLLVDDAHRLALHSLDLLRRLHDRTGLRLVLAGPPTVRSVVRRKCIELAHRLHGVVTLPPCTLSDIPALLPSARRTDPTLSDTLHTCTGGNLYWLTEGVRLARLDARKQHRRLTSEQVQRLFDHDFKVC